MNLRNVFLIVIILVISFALRFYKVTENPPSLNWDEVSIAYNANSIMQTGKDEWGEFMPVHFRAFGEFKLPVQIYASIPGIWIFGLNELGVRITPVVYGTLSVLVIFFLSLTITKSYYIGLIAAFLLAISPWHIHLTRGSFESSFAMLWVSLGVLFLIKGFEKSVFLIPSLVAFAVSIYTYNTARAFVPLFLISVAIIYGKRFLKSKKESLIAVLIFLVLMIPFVMFLINGEGDSRYKLVSISDDPGLIPRINENRGNSMFPYPVSRLVHNKATYLSFYFTKNYLAHLSPDFLFISGAPHRQHHVQNIGELYLFQAPFLLLGFYLILKNNFRWIILCWIFLSFVPVSLTQDSIPHALRTLIVLPALQTLSAMGMYQVWKRLSNFHKKFKVVFIILAIIILGVSAGNYLREYYLVYPSKYSRDWQYGYKQVVEYINENQDKYDEIVFTRHYGEPHIFTLFFLNYSPLNFQTNPNLNRFETYDWVRVLKFDKFYFPDLGDPGTRYEDIIKETPSKKRLFIGKSGDFPPEANLKKKIYFLNGNEAFDIVESK